MRQDRKDREGREDAVNKEMSQWTLQRKRKTRRCSGRNNRNMSRNKDMSRDPKRISKL